MDQRFAVAVACCSLGLLSACSGGGDSSGSSGGLQRLVITASAPSVLANGSNTVVVHVETSGAGPIAVSTSRGTFLGGNRSAVVPGSAGDLVLVTCDAASDGTCAGVAQLVALTAGGTARATAAVTFGGYELCAASCNADAACAGRACNPAGGGTGVCSGAPPAAACAPPACAPTETPEASCGDGLDNDCDRAIDCADDGCEGQPCQAGSPTFLCQSGGCADVASGLGIALAAGRTRLPADGLATTTVVATVRRQTTPQAGVAVTFATDLGTLSEARAVTGADGTARVTFTASATAGTASVTARIEAVPAVSASAALTMPVLQTIQLGSVQYGVLGVRGSGYRETSAIAVALLDDQGKPYPDGLSVRFQHVRYAGSLLGDPLAPDTADCVAAAGCVGYLGSTDASGLARVTLRSGTLAGTMEVEVSATAGGLTRTFTVPALAAIGARANGANFAVVCSPRNVPALADTNCSTSNVEAQITCEALLKDRFDNLLGTATQVTFLAEAGAVGPPVQTPAYDPAKPPAQQLNLGKAQQVVQTKGGGLPADVAPNGDEPSAVHDLDGCGSPPGTARVHNPRDGVVTIVAIADGEEAFFDANGNGGHDDGEAFVDLGEPFVDRDDDGLFTQGEDYLDLDASGGWTGPNGRWDGATKIWTQTVVVYSGAPAGPLPATGGLLGSRWIAGEYPGACTATPSPPPFEVFAPTTGTNPTPATTARYSVAASDLNLNRLATSTTYAVAVQSPGKVTVAYRGFDKLVDDWGFSFRYWPCDAAQPTSCSNQCQAGTCLMRPAVADYGCGYGASVDITGVSPPDGANTLQWNVTTTYQLQGSAPAYLLRTLQDGLNTTPPPPP